MTNASGSAKNTGMKLRYSGCPLCGSGAFVWHKRVDATAHPFYDPKLDSPILEWMRCETCGHVFTSTYWTAEGWKLIFEKAYANQVASLTEAEIHRHISARIIGKVIDLFIKFRVSPEMWTWLDVGCGNGSLMFTADEFGFDAHGLDLREDAVAAVNKLGYSASCEAIEQYADGWRGQKYFDVVSMADLLEHTPHPKDVLRSAKSVMKDGGLLYVSCPNSDCAIWKMLGDENPYWLEIEHFHNFSRVRLTDLLEECGFDVLYYGITERYRSGMEMICRVRA